MLYRRYVSHEVRSPLAVSIAGLDMIKREILETNASGSLIELINDVFDSNEAAVSILNELLQYESMDAGTFTVQLEKLRVAGLFGGKLQSIRVRDTSVLVESLLCCCKSYNVSRLRMNG
jgi:K+-sensing histidine kinase KdpD